MATNLLNVPLENNFKTVLVKRFEAADLILYCAKVPVATIPVGQKIRITINPLKGSSFQEDVLVNAIDTVNKTLSISSLSDRGLDRWAGDAAAALIHEAQSVVIISNPYGLWKETQAAVNAKVDQAGGAMTGPLSFTGATNWGIVAANLTTTQRDALVSPPNGIIIYNTTAGEFQIRQGGTWQPVASGSTQPDASLLVAGKVQLGSAADLSAGTAVGSTGAPLVVDPSVVKPFLVPTGTIFAYGTTVAPSGYSLCNGGAISRTTFAALFAVIGTTFGAGDGSTTFNVPDLRGRAAFGKTAAGTFLNMGATGGAETKDVSHSHTLSAAGRALIGAATAYGDAVVGWKVAGGPFTGNRWGRATGGNNATSGNGNVDNGAELSGSTDTGGSATQNVMNPYLVVNFIIKT